MTGARRVSLDLAIGALVFVAALVAQQGDPGPLRTAVMGIAAAYLPGSLAVLALWPADQRPEFGLMDRVTVSFGLSVVGAAGTGLILWALGVPLLAPQVVAGWTALNAALLATAAARWYRTPAERRWRPSLPLTHLPKTAVVPAVVAVVAIALAAILVAAPAPQERYTEFSVLGPTGDAMCYPERFADGNFTADGCGTVEEILMGITNREGRTAGYDVRVGWAAALEPDGRASTFREFAVWTPTLPAADEPAPAEPLAPQATRLVRLADPQGDERFLVIELRLEGQDGAPYRHLFLPVDVA